jgi:3-dehydroquinate dehydratase type I
MRDPLVCVAVTAATIRELRRRRDAAAKEGGADLVELRLDHLERPDAAAAAAAIDGRLRPVIVTCRAQWEGGEFAGSEEARQQILESAIAAGAEFVDVEARASFAPDIIRIRRGRGVVLSSHVVGPVPADLEQRFAAMHSAGAEIVKLAIEAGSLGDTLRLMRLADTRGPTEASHVLIAMGELAAR